MWLAKFAYQKLMDRLIVIGIFERLSREKRLVIQLQPTYCIWAKRNKPSDKLQMLYLSIRGVVGS